MKLKFGQPEDIGWVALYLASDASRFVSMGQALCDGGAKDCFKISGIGLFGNGVI